MEILNMDSFNNPIEASMYYLSAMNDITNQIGESVKNNDGQMVLSLGKLFMDMMDLYELSMKEVTSLQRKGIEEIMRPYLN